MLILGDDNILIGNIPINIEEYSAKCKQMYNQLPKPIKNKGFGTFCTYMVYVNSKNNVELGPDWFRMMERFSVTSGEAR